MKTYPPNDEHITIFNEEDGTPILIIEKDSFELVNGEIKFNIEDKYIDELIELLGINNKEGEN